MNLRDRAVDAGFGAGWSIVRRMPQPIANSAFQAGADVMWRRQGPSVLQLRSNLSRVLRDDQLSDLDDITRDGLRRYLRYWQEAFRLPGLSTQQIAESFQVDAGLHHLDDAMAGGDGAIMALPHMGNWDLAGAWATLRYGGLTTVAERLKPESLYDRFVDYRTSLGMEILPLGGTDTIRLLADRLRGGSMVCLLADRDLQGSGIPVDFFSSTASMPAGPAMLSLMTGAPLMPVSVWHTDEGTRATIEAPLPIPDQGPRGQRVRQLTQSAADAFARGIAEHPADWHMMQKLWHEDLRPIESGPRK